MTEEEKEEITELETTEEAQPEAQPKIDWIQNFSVKEVRDIETIDRLTVKAGINEYKGSHLVFLAKVTDKNFSRQFFSMPAYMWEKALPVLAELIPKIAEAEKRTMADNIKKEMLRLKELGIDIKAIAESV